MHINRNPELTLEEFYALYTPPQTPINVYGLDQYGELICDSTWDATGDWYECYRAIYDFMEAYGDRHVETIFVDDDGILSAFIRL